MWLVKVAYNNIVKLYTSGQEKQEEEGFELPPDLRWKLGIRSLKKGNQVY